MNKNQKIVATVLAEARAEALNARPASCAALNSVIRRLAEEWQLSDSERDEFLLTANYEGMDDGSTRYGLLQ